MPRHARLDAEGVLHHIIIRGIERRLIFRDDVDKDCFVERMARYSRRPARPVMHGLSSAITRIFF